MLLEEWVLERVLNTKNAFHYIVYEEERFYNSSIRWHVSVYIHVEMMLVYSHGDVRRN